MKKTMIKLLAGTLAAVFALSPLSGNALYTETDMYSSDYAELTRGLTKLENFHQFDMMTNTGSSVPGMSEVYVNDDGTYFMAFRKIERSIAVLDIADKTDNETIESAIKEEFGVKYSLVSYGYNTASTVNTYMIALASSAGIYSPDISQASKICDFLKAHEYITSFRLITERRQVYDIYGYGVNVYDLFDPRQDTETTLREYVKNNLPGYSVKIMYENYEEYGLIEEGEYNSGKFAVIVPDKELSLMEQIDISQQIYEDTGIVFYGVSPDKTLDEVSAAPYIDIFNAVKGDANNDGTTSIADATAILQYLGNRDKYPLTAQGEFNADITGDSDGITAADALEIQKLDSTRNATV